MIGIKEGGLFGLTLGCKLLSDIFFMNRRSWTAEITPRERESRRTPTHRAKQEGVANLEKGQESGLAHGASTDDRPTPGEYWQREEREKLVRHSQATEVGEDINTEELRCVPLPCLPPKKATTMEISQPCVL